VLSSPDNAFSRGQRFFDEAQRLWQAEEEISLPNIQALLLMCCVYVSPWVVKANFSRIF
jgi:hypothetical protein